MAHARVSARPLAFSELLILRCPGSLSTVVAPGASPYWRPLPARVRQATHGQADGQNLARLSGVILDSERDEAEVLGETGEVAGIAGEDCLAGLPGAHCDVRVGNVGRAGFREQESYGGRTAGVERDDVGEGLTDEAREAGLFGGIPDRLSESSRRDCDPHARLDGSRNEDEHATVVAVEGDERAGV